MFCENSSWLQSVNFFSKCSTAGHYKCWHGPKYASRCSNVPHSSQLKDEESKLGPENYFEIFFSVNLVQTNCNHLQRSKINFVFGNNTDGELLEKVKYSFKGETKDRTTSRTEFCCFAVNFKNKFKISL